MKMSDEFKVVLVLLCAPWFVGALGMALGARINERALRDLEVVVARSNADIVRATR